ncbi:MULTISPECIES: ABC transporter substrate-binding protein [Streptomyces]|uniref:Glycine/betaine ABC transporter substrate-binding protein n=2 Tax=Streptomyces TaxID=1883 RepID=A0A117RFK8_9ACTN|nr:MULTISPECIES: ABC transporter substrate-binding protein [Streptomyces]KUN88078.1 glycine/betaine ABC transporter substrate-binding protein [Streptomyces griseoruber]MCX4761826.1 ABC transporter substrate-binding protein [Streptomyces sp. NBC_01275]WSN38262.1 ABC transporter substrate-binding protein [Streptomyces sp. NBC_01334]BBC36569.1 Glycine/betaine ABC transporter substrate-binding protein [Streptomyces graminofaciens]
MNSASTRSKKLLGLAALTATGALVLTACGSGGDPMSTSATAGASSAADTITVGSANFTESQLLATIYAEALKAKGVKVKTRLNIGSRETYIPALKDGSIDLLPEYTGALLQYFDPKTKASSPAEVSAALTKALPSGISALKQSTAEDKDVLAVTQKTATAHDLTTISDLAPVAGTMALGAPPEWKTRVNGVVGLKSVYGLSFKKFVSLDAGGPLTLAAITNNQVQVGDLTSTDPAIAKNKLVTLKDDKNLFLAENILPVINKDKVTPTVTSTLNAVSAALTTEGLMELNSKVAKLDDMSDVAKAWLTSAGLS